MMDAINVTMVKETIAGISAGLPRKAPSAFCGEYFNATRVDNERGVLANECFLNGLR